MAAFTSTLLNVGFQVEWIGPDLSCCTLQWKDPRDAATWSKFLKYRSYFVKT